ncbi:hypothetical protein FO519_004377 [Halicephalobus sp. NKZ332]|nr:hypothetical protein FO519_004377 [Halicephalobus sp. NKZ332]
MEDHPFSFPPEILPDGQMFPEVDEDMFFHRPSSLPHLNGAFGKFDEIQEMRFLESFIPRQPLPEIQSSQSESENEFIERLMPLTISADCNTRDRRSLLDPGEVSSKPNLPDFPMNPPALFVEEQESSRDYIMGGYAPLHFGTLLAEKYYVIRKLGFGNFSTVWLVLNKNNQTYSALKISRATYDYVQTSVEEVQFLRRISNASGAPGSNRVVCLLEEFSHYSPFGTHHCAILEPLGHSLYQLIVQSGQVGASLLSIKKIAQQLLEGLRFLHEDVGVIHTDLKPENITIGATEDTFRQWAKIALTDFATGQRTKFAHANFPSSIKDQLETCNEIIYFDSVRRLEKSRPNLVKLLWEKEFSEEGSYEEFARKEREVFIEKEEKKKEHQKETEHQKGLESQEPEVDEDDSSDIDSLILNPETEFKIVDLGTAQYTDHLTSNQFQTLQYRSPEAVLRAHITPAIDIWSLACVLYEAATGDYLFNPVGNREALDQNRSAKVQFQCFIAILGSPPSDLKQVFSKNRIYKSLFTPDGKFIDEPNVGTVSIEKHIKRHINEPEDFDRVTENQIANRKMSGRILAYFFMLVLLLGLASESVANEDGPKRASPLLSRYGRAVLSRYGKRSDIPELRNEDPQGLFLFFWKNKSPNKSHFENPT